MLSIIRNIPFQYFDVREGVVDIAGGIDAEGERAACDKRSMVGVRGVRHGAGAKPGAVGDHLGDGRADSVGERSSRAGADADGLGVCGAGQHDGGADR